MLKILIVNQNDAQAGYLGYIIEKILPGSQVLIVPVIESVAEKFDLIILDNQKALDVAKGCDNIIIHSFDTNFVLDSIKQGREIVLRTEDIFTKLEVIISRQGLV